LTRSRTAASPRSLDAALSEWARLLGPDRTLTGPQAARAYGPCTLGASRDIAAALKPTSTQEVIAILRVARRHSVALYPISTGRNWGYGAANPVVDGCAIVDLSGMDRILEVDAELGLVTLEPGVTQGRLREYLDERGLPFLVPVHGGGPSCSLLGNALERGYGITPYADHFGAVMAIEAVLPTGEIYRSPLSDLGGPGFHRAFKWGVGPYLDGVFTQSSFGIVTQMTIALAPAPERVTAFFFGLARDEDLEEAVARIRGALREVGAVMGAVNLMNARRILSMMVPYPRDAASPGAVLSEQTVARLCARNRIMPWTGAGALYGDKTLVRAARGAVRRKLRPLVKRLAFVTPARLATARTLLGGLPGRTGRLDAMVRMLERTLAILNGRPSQVALPLAYWKSGCATDPADLNPARDGCGLIWYSPLVPMKPERVRAYVDMVEAICTAHGLEPLITLTSLSDRCFDSTVPLLFDRNNGEEAGRARACYEALFRAGRDAGFLPYRANIESMPLFIDPKSGFWQVTERVKGVLDPSNILAPGRYGPR
jgi:4-cresol dehydrogenase (hydroxylating)